MFTPLPPDVCTPPDSTVLWRYMDLGKLLSLLATSKLHLASLDRLTDKYEGLWPETTTNAAAANWPSQNYENFVRLTHAMRSAHFVNCWSASTRESSVMWSSYAGSQGIALVSTVVALKASVLPGTRFYIGQVEYLDFQSAPIQSLNLYRVVYLKRSEFESEKEVRILVSALGPEQQNPNPIGTRGAVQLQVELPTLVKEIVVASSAPSYLLPAVQGLLARAGLGHVPVRASVV
jgi:hypothetical protein